MFYEVLNKVRVGVVDEQVKEVLGARYSAYNPGQHLWETSHLSALRDDADNMNTLIINNLPPNFAFTSESRDYENGNLLDDRYRNSRVFKRNTNFPASVTCKPGARVMFLHNSMLGDRGIANGSVGVVLKALDREQAEVAFPTKNGIQVRYYISSKNT